MRKLLLAALIWAVALWVYSAHSGAAPAVQLQNYIVSFVFNILASIWLWILPLKRWPRLISIGVSLPLVSIYITWQITRIEFVKGIGLYALYFTASFVFLSAILGALLFAVELLDYFVSVVSRRP